MSTKDTAKPILWVIIPCYNEQEVLPMTAPIFREELEHLVETGRVSKKSRVLFVDDGSEDETWNIICRLSRGKDGAETERSEASN